MDELIEPSTEQINLATQNYLLLIASNKIKQGHESLVDKIKEKEKRLGVERRYWDTDMTIIEGSSEATASKHRSRLKLIAEGMSHKECNKNLKKEYLFTSFSNAISESDEYINKLNKLLSIPDEVIKNHTKPINTSKNELNGCEWYAYFLFYPPKVEEDKEPLLGRGIVSIEEHEFEGKTYNVKFDNPPNLKNSLDYHGYYDSYLDIGGTGNFLKFSLHSLEKGRALHIKLYCSKINQEILTGQFMTYEDHNIYSGTILFQRIKTQNEVYLRNPKAKAFSFKSSAKDFLKINHSIREYFSLKEHNYFYAEQGIETLADLSRRLEIRNNSINRESLFLEKPNPEVFFSSPSSSNNDEIEKIADKLKKEFRIFDIKVNSPDRLFNQFGVPNLPKRLSVLKSTRIFVLFLDDVVEFSYSMIQFSWALTYCKEVVLVYKEHTISKTLQKLEEENRYHGNKELKIFHHIKIESDKSFETENNKIYTDLHRIFTYNLTREGLI